MGFTHFWGRSRTGKWVVKRRTARSRFRRALRSIAGWCRQNRHLSVAEQSEVLGQKLRGHFGYYGIVGNTTMLQRFRYEVVRVWRKWLCRRRRRFNCAWDWFNRLLRRYPLPEGPSPWVLIGAARG